MRSLNRIATLSLRNIKEIVREPLSLIFSLGLPLVMEIGFYYIFHDLTPQFGIKYLAPGIIAFSQTFLTLFTGILVSVDRNSSFLTRLYVSKAKPFEFILGYVFALLPVGIIQSILFFIAGGIIDPTFFSAGMLAGIGVSAITAIFYIGFGILFGSLCNEKSVGGISSIIITGQSVLSGMWFPLEGLSEGFLTIMRILPLKTAPI